MKRYVLAIVSLGLVGMQTVDAGLFDKKPKSPAADAPQPETGRPTDLERVQALVSRLLLDKDASRREQAAEHLRHFDPQKFPEIVTALIEAAQKDGDSDVRREAVKSLGKIRPTTAEGLQALEQAGKDSSYLVRFEARLARWGYKVADAPAPAPPESGRTMVRIPPAGPDGRLKPVPIPSPDPPPSPASAAPPRASLSQPVLKAKEEAGAGPILVAPKK